MNEEGTFGKRGQFDTKREYANDLMSRLGKGARDKIRDGGEEGKRWKAFLRTVDVLLEREMAVSDICDRAEKIVDQINPGRPIGEEIRKEIAAIQKKAEWVKEISIKLRNTEGEIHDALQEALTSIEAALKQAE